MCPAGSAPQPTRLRVRRRRWPMRSGRERTLALAARPTAAERRGRVVLVRRDGMIRRMITYRSGSAADARILFEIFEAAIDDLGARMQASANSTAGDPDAWERRRPLFEHLAQTGDRLWIAERDG